MATRATYSFTGPFDVTTNVYCHWDGYEQGAAVRFHNMIRARFYTDVDGGVRYRTGGLAYAFIAGNHDAEPSGGRDAHGDTEFHYELSHFGTVKAFARESYGSDEWKLIEESHVVDFVNKHLAGEMLAYTRKALGRVRIGNSATEGFEPLFRDEKGSRYGTLSLCKAKADKYRAMAEYAESKGHTGNAESHKRDAEAWEAMTRVKVEA